MSSLPNESKMERKPVEQTMRGMSLLAARLMRDEQVGVLLVWFK